MHDVMECVLFFFHRERELQHEHIERVVVSTNVIERGGETCQTKDRRWGSKRSIESIELVQKTDR
jgi:hypothetical protein